jgi:F0F1-type ATP synthase assembly protein I
MAQAGPSTDKERSERALRMALAGIVGQVGCLTLAIIAVALGLGLWLDSQFHTRPLFSLALVLGSVPVTLYIMFRVVLSVAPKIQMHTDKATRGESKKETDLGTDTQD